jgi:dolichol-phosphate mannosyltransferase
MKQNAENCLTIIVPVFNEALCLNMFAQEMDRFIAAAPLPVQVLFIDDGSKDASLEIIQSICVKSRNYGYVSLSENRGLSTAIKTGIDMSTTNLIGYIDADLQTTPSDFLKFLPYLPEFDLVNGIRQSRMDTWVKRISSKIANSFRRRLLNDGILDTCCPLKIAKTTYLKKIPFFNGSHRFLPALVIAEGGRIKQVPVRHFARVAGKSKYHLANRLVGPFLDTMVVAYLTAKHIDYSISGEKKCGRC